MWKDEQVLRFLGFPLSTLIDTKPEQGKKNKWITVKFSQEEWDELDFLKEKYGISRNGIIRIGLRIVLTALKFQKGGKKT